MTHDRFPKYRFATRIRSFVIATAFCLVGQASAAAPDLTAGGVPNDSDQWNLGPTGMAGWCYREGITTTNARQFQVKSVATGSPAAGIMAVNDVILGASGTGAAPGTFTQDARIAFAQAITDAEERNPATLKILRWRAGVTSIVSVTLETLGAYSATAPYNCPKSAAILEKGIQWMMNTNANDGNWRYSALTLLAANDTNNPNNIARQAKAAADARQLILSPETIALYTSGKSMGRNDKPWHVGPKLIALSEYYLQTGDPDPNVMDSIRAYAHCVANGQSFLGTCGHFFTDPGFRNTPVNGPYNIGYGPINNAALPCYIGLILAKKCGLNDPEILAGIQRSGTFYSFFTHLGCAGYGEHLPYEGHDTNGKAGLQALAFQLEGNRPESTKYYARASTAAAIAERDIGHTGSFFAFLYAPLGANVGGPDAMAYYFRETKWMYELARRWDGSFVYNSFSSGGVEVDAIYGQGNCLMATPMLLTYALPLRQTYLTGKNQDTANWITPAELPEVSAASAHIYNAPSRTTPELVSDLASWSPKVRRYAARELKLRTADHATVLPTLHATAANESATMQARAGACAAMGEIGDSSSVPVLLPLVTHPNFVVRFSASNAIRYMPTAANQPHVDALMQACITNAKPLLPLDAEDPMQTVNGNLCLALFAPYAALHTHNFVGLNRELLYGAMRVCAANAQADVRKGLYNHYSKLTQTDIENLGDVFVNIAYENAPAGMGITEAREPAMSFLQSKGKAEGVPLAIRFAEDLGYDNGGIVNPLNVLLDYAGSSNTVTPNPDVDHFCQILIASGAKYGIPESQAVLNAIAADTSPDVLTPFKSIDLVIPDQATFNLPKNSTVLRVHSKNRSNPNSTYTWRKLRGAGAVTFTPNGTSAAKDATVVFDGIPGEYLFEVTMSDSHGLTEVSKTVTVTLRNTDGSLPPNSPPTANDQSLTLTQGTPSQVILTGTDPEGRPLSYTVTSSAAHGTLSGTPPHLTYTPAANYTGADSIVFEVEDSEGEVDLATVDITVNTSSPVGLAIYEPFDYSVGNLHAASGTGSIGLNGTWTSGAQITTELPSLTYGTLPSTGTRVKSVSVGIPGASRPLDPAALAGRGLLDNGATLWFSVVMGGYGGWNAGGNAIDLALANNSFPYGSNIPNDGATPGSGLGVRMWNKGVYAAQYFDTSVGAPLTGGYDKNVTGGILNDYPRLVVGKITWGATSDTVEIYLPLQDMALPSQPTSVLTANVDQYQFDTLTFSRGQNVILDEIRFGPTLQSVLQGTVEMSSDVTAPTPNPMTFALAPAPEDSSSITMTATPAHDGLGVEYLFTCTAGGGNSSGWQTSNVYTDTGLTPGVTYSYTVKARDQHPALNETTASSAASATIPALGIVPTVEGLPDVLAQTLITDAHLTVGTVTQSVSYSMTVPAGHVLSQSPSAGSSAPYGSPVDLVISIGQDPVLPVLTPANIVDDKNGEQVELGTPITFTLTFSKDIDAATLDAADFTNAGDAAITIGTITETSPGVVTVSVTPTGAVSGILRFAVAQGAVIEDTLGNDLNTTSPIIDNTAISIVPIQPKTQIFTGPSGGNSVDNWSTVLNWNTNTGPVPSGTDNVIISDTKQVMANLTTNPLYSGNLTLASGAHLQAGNGINNLQVYNCLGTPGTTTISMAEGSRISFRDNNSPVMPAIVLQGNAEITTGSSTSVGANPIFNYPITGPYALTITGKSPNTTNLNIANNFGHLILGTQYGTLFTVNANTAGALGGNVTVLADYNTGGKGANLIFATANAMADTATLTLYGNTGTLVTVNANDTIGGLKLSGVKQLPGTYNSGNSSWLAGTGTLTVAGETTAYWNPSGGPSGTWDDSAIWNDQANLSGTDSAWTPGHIAAFNATGTYGVTLSNTKEISGLVVSNGTLTLTEGGLSLSSDAPFHVASGASLTINTVIEQNTLGLGLHKSGAGTLLLLGENTFTGPVAIGAGTLSIATIGDAGAPSALGQYPDSGTDGLILAGGTLRYTGGTTTVNRGLTFAGSSTIDVNNPGSSLTLANVVTAGPGTLTANGGENTSLSLGNIKIVQSNNITLNPTTTTMSVASVEGYSNYPLNATITLSGSSTGNIITGNIYASVYQGSSYQQGTGVVKTGTGDWRISGAMTAGAVGNNNVTVNEGTLTLAGNNTFTGNTLINNGSKLMLDFATTDTSKLGGGVFLAGTLELVGGSHIEVVGSTTLNAGPTSFITRNGGTAKLRMNAITRYAGSTISFLDNTVADTDRINTNGILGGYATVGGDWAVNGTNGTDGPVTALSSYDALPSSGGSATANYLLNGSGTLTGALAANSLKIANSDVNQSLDLGSNTITVTTTSASALGGVLYAGGGNNTYTIHGTGGILASTTTGELVIHSHIGTLTVNAPVVTSGATAGLLTKSGNGSLVLGGTNVYTGATRVASGKLFVNGSLSNQNSALTVDAGATLGGSGTLGRNITIAHNGKLEFTLGAPAASHVPLTRSSSRTMAFSGASVLTITAGSNAAPGLYTLITGGNNITGSAPATVILPPGWTADPPVISTNQLRINITSVVSPPANVAPVWTSNPVNETDAPEDADYSTTLANDASDSNNDVLTFLKVNGPSWLNIATNGSLSGTPSNSDVGANIFTVSVADGIAPALQATLNITVTNTNDAPVWSNNPLAGPDATEDAPYSQSLATEASDVDSGSVLTFAKVSGPSWLSVATDGSLSGTPSNADVGLNVFTVSVSDGIAAPVETALQITVINTNDAPFWTINPISGGNIVRDLPYTGNIAGSATDVDLGAMLTFSKVFGPAWLTVAGNGALSGTPTTSDVSINTFTVAVSDGIATPVTASFVLNVVNSNVAPVPQAQSVSTDEDTALPITLTATDEDGNPLTYSVVTQPTKGILSGTAPNLTYTPNSDQNAADSFTFKVNDTIVDSDIATISITINPINDAPVFTANPTVLATGTETVAYTGQTLAGKATDVDAGDTLTYSKISGPEWLNVASNGAITGTPPLASTGLNSFVVRATDSASATVDATLEITVNIYALIWDANTFASGQANGAGAWLGNNLWYDPNLLPSPLNLNWTSGSNAIFGGENTAAGAVTLASPTTVNIIQFNTFTGTYTLGTSGQALTINSGIDKTPTSAAVNIISPVILGASQTWTNNSPDGLTASSTFDNAGHTLTADGTGTTTINGVISGAGSFVKNGTGRLIFGNGTNTYTGTTTINSGTLQMAAAAASLGSGNLVLNGGNLGFYWSTGLTRTLGSGSNQVSIPGGESGFGGSGLNPTVNLGTTVVWGATGEGAATGHFNPSKFVLGDADKDGTNTFSSAIDLNGAARTILVPFGTSGNNVATLSGVISNGTGTAGLIKEGGGILILNKANTYNGGTIVEAGTIQLDHATGLGATSGELTMNGGLLNLNGQTNVTVGNLTGTGGTIVNNASNARTFIIGAGDGTGGDYQGVIADKTSGTGTIALTKTGTGTITLSGTNSYTGATSINQGKLFIHGDQSLATGNVSVAANATLGGTGTIGGNTTIATGGQLELDISTPAASHDRMDLASGRSLTFSDTSLLTITSSSGATPGVYTLLTAPGGISGATLPVLSLPDGWGATLSISGNDLLLDVITTGTVLTNPSTVDVPETATATFQVKLSRLPAADVTVTVSRSSGDADVTVQSGASLVFTPGNWDTYQTVTLAAAGDIDALNSNATITCTPDDPSFSAANLTATETDLESTLTVASGGNGTTSPFGSLNVSTNVATAISATASEGYDFANWTVVSGSATFGNENSAATTVTITAPTTIQANFALKMYTVSYDGNGNTGGTAPASHNKTHDADLTLLGNSGFLLKTGHAFIGWNTDPGGMGTHYDVGATYSNNAAITLYAHWIEGTLLTWDANGTGIDQTNGGGAWGNANLWWNGTFNTNWESGATATFGGPNTAGGAVTLASPTTANAIQFNAFTGTYTLGTGGQALTINNGINKTSSSAVATIISPVVLGASQTWTNNSPSGLTASSTFDNGGHTLTADGTGNTTLSGVISGSGGFVKNGPGLLSFGNLSNANTYTGPTTVNGGFLSLANNSGSLGSGNLTINNGVVTFYWSASFASRTLGTGSNQVSIPGGESGFGGNASSAPTINLGSTIVWGASGEGTATGHFNPSKFVLGSAYASAGGTVFSSGIDLNGAARTIVVPFGIHATNANNATLSGVISNGTGTAGLIKEGGGILQLNVANTYNGGTIVQAGTIQLGHATGLGATSGELTMNGGLLNLNGQTNVTVGNLTGTGGTVANNASNARTFIIGSGNGSGGNYQGVIADKTSGTGIIALTKTGTGSITLSGTNSYTGVTNINQGTLFIHGDQSLATGNVSVAANATLGGTGTIGGNTTIATGGRLEFDISTPAASHDRLDLASDRSLTFSGTSLLTITSSSGATPGVYTLLTAPGGISGATLPVLNLPSGWAASLSLSGNDLLLDVIATSGGTPGSLVVSDVGGLTASGYLGGPFAPNPLVYTISNPGQTAVSWTASKSAGWITLGATSGTIASGGSTEVAVAINSAADALAVGNYSDTLTFANTSYLASDVTRGISLGITPLPTYQVSYDGNGNTDGSAPIDQVKTHGIPLVLSTSGTLARTGYVFSGWNTVADGSGDPYAAEASYTANAAVTLFAQWTAASYTVTFASNGGDAPSPASTSVTYDSSYGALASVSRAGYSFTGWFTEASGGTQVTAGTTVSTASNHTLHAQWSPNSYTVSFDANDGEAPTPTSISVTHDATYGALATTSRIGYTFTGWFTAPTGGTQVTSETSVAITDNQTLHAQWTLTPVSVVTDAATVNVPEGATSTFQVKLSNQPAAAVTVTVSHSAGDADVTVQSGASLTFTTGNWDTYQTVTLAAAADVDAVNSSATITCTPDEPAYTAANVTATETDSETTLSIASGGNGTTSPTGALIVATSAATAISATANEGYDFVNWTVTSGSATFADANSAATTVTITSPATVQANFTIRQYTLTYAAGSGGTLDGVTSQTVNHGDNGTQVSAVPNTGYSFVKWSDNVLTAPRTDNAVISNITVTAEFSANTYDVVFDANGGTTADPSSNQVTFGAPYGTLATTSRPGYIFDGWFTLPSGGIRVVSGTTVTTAGNHTLYARWITGPGLIWADSYITTLGVASPTTVNSSLNFPSFLDGPLTGSSNLTLTGYVGGQSSFVHNGTGNTFDGNIIVDSGTLRVGANPFASSAGGFTAPSMTSSNTITINRAGTLFIDDNSATGYTANRFGSASRPSVNMVGGTINLNGLNNASSSVQTLGPLIASSGQATHTVTRNSSGNPTLTFDSLAISKCAVANFYSATLGTGSGDARITFGTTPTLTNGIIAGAKVWNPGAAGVGELATYGANGVTAFTAYDVVSNDINGATSTQNVAVTLATTPVTLSADTAVNSLNYRGNGGTWSLGGNKLTLTSGMFLRNGTNSGLAIDTGTLTAGNGTDDTDLHIFTAQNSVTINAVIADNSDSAVTLVKSHGNTLTVSGGANNTYTGGTYVVDGTLTTGNTANRTYLGTDKVTVDNATLTLGNIGATSNATGDDYTAINGGRINVASGTSGVYTSADTFNIAANSIIAGGSASGQGLASLTRDTNVTLAPGAIIAHNALTSALNLTTGTIQNLGINADLYYGLNADQNNASASINIGNGTAFRGISTDRSARSWQQGTLHIASGTTSVDFQGHATHGATSTLTLGNGATAGNPVINVADTGTVDINALGSLTLNDSTATYGNTGANQNVRFVAKAGSTLTITPATGMGSGTGIASALVQNGGSLAIGNTTALNGAVTVETGGRLVANQASGLTGSGQLTFNEGSIIHITHATGWSGTQASAANIAAGTIVRVGVNNPGTASETLDSFFASKSPIYQLTGSDIDVPEPTSLTTTLTLNKNGSGVGGILTNGMTGTFFRNNVNGQVSIGANGGVIAATSGTELQVQENITGTGVTLTIGTTDIIDGAPKLGSVAFGSAAGNNSGFTGETIINAGTLRTGYADVLGATTNQLTVHTGGTLLMNNNNQTVGNLTGTGGAINLGSGTLTIGNGDTGGGNYQGSIQGSGGKITKTGTGTITLSGTNTYTGVTTISAGTLIINGDQTAATGNISVSANATLGGTGTLGGTTTISANGKLEFDISTDAASHNPLDFVSGKSLTFSGASTLTITSSGGASPGLYTLVTGGNNIGGVAPATLNLPVGWTATVSFSGNNLLLNVTSTSAPGPVDHFIISSIASPQTVGTPITGITITAQDASNRTATSFTGTVTFSGTAGITGTSANFVDGVLTGISLTPTLIGADLTLIVDDGSSHTGQAAFTVLSRFNSWAGTYSLTGDNALSSANPDGDNLTNIQEFAFGMNPNSPLLSPLSYVANGNTTGGTPILEKSGSTYRAVFARRKDYEVAGLTYTVSFSADLTSWTASATSPVRLSGDNADTQEAVSIDFPTTVPLQAGGSAAPQFFRVAVTGN